MILFRVRQRGSTPELLAKEFRACLKEAWKAPGKLWHREMRPKHFTPAGGKEYGYLPRQGEGMTGKRFWQSYTGRKLRKKRHTRPLVYSGESEQLTRLQDIRTTSKGVRVVMRANKLNFRPKNGRINMREELTRISPVEVPQLEASLDGALQQQIDAIRATKETAI